MTLPQSTNLSPEELRILCAEGIGLTNVQGRGAWYGYLPNGNAESIPDYPTDANAALLLVEKLRKDGLDFGLENVGGVNGGYWVIFFDPKSPLTKSYAADADTAPLAIARCFAIATGRAA